MEEKSNAWSVRGAADLVTGLVMGRLVGVDEHHVPRVDYPSNVAGPLAARSLVPIWAGCEGSEVALAFEEGDSARPIIVGFLQPVTAEHDDDELATDELPAETEPAMVTGFPAVTIEESPQRLVLSAEQQIELRCGKASIILTRAGKVLIRGQYVLSRAAGVHRIRGGSVQIN
ncbi:MAG: DUF6484 domain-containing protein [Pirellulaceae bacterium]